MGNSRTPRTHAMISKTPTKLILGTEICEKRQKAVRVVGEAIGSPARRTSNAGGETGWERARRTFFDGIGALLLLLYLVGVHGLVLAALVLMPGRRHVPAIVARSGDGGGVKRRVRGTRTAAREKGRSGAAYLRQEEEAVAGEARARSRSWGGDFFVFVFVLFFEFWGGVLEEEQAGSERRWGERGKKWCGVSCVV